MGNGLVRGGKCLRQLKGFIMTYEKASTQYRLMILSIFFQVKCIVINLKENCNGIGISIIGFLMERNWT